MIAVFRYAIELRDTDWIEQYKKYIYIEGDMKEYGFSMRNYQCSSFSPSCCVLISISGEFCSLLIPSLHTICCIMLLWPGEPDPNLTARISKFLSTIRNGISFNQQLTNKVDYRNPSLLEKIVEIDNIWQYGTCLRKEVFDPIEEARKEDTAHALAIERE